MQDQQSNPGNSGPVVSEFADDPDMLELVEMFVDELPQRVQSLQSSFESQMMDELLRLSHQLKGACGGYGFPSLSEAAAELEGLLKSGAGDPGQIEAAMNELVDLCRRASPGPGQGD
ncbi:MAG: Hpt domain-containing protein [Planctomycetes bacterium]|nr:Hpt domain-containing protein [Planctomycetota bacterium]